ncbi:hypothetical protein [Bradyrhizobium sp. CB3481]|uniref:hypothetical protein n=1 Tax=Bradyrhizobium sp. CB3481 TaxID=3039158 RepID=UPI0024B13DEC|nr:hypothetical protein [Bradyrhizobium sp. CB3481]WFU20222.1 hypothetical protein QA643_18755 [Bradyrhizobium sp. CB3481]
MGATVMRVPDPNLTPARAGLIMIGVLVLGVIFVRVLTMSEQSEVRTDTTSGNAGRATVDVGGIKGLRGSLP